MNVETHAIRFKPPKAEPSHDTRWVLQRAFGYSKGSSSFNASIAAVGIARNLDLIARIGARVPFEVLEKDVGTEAATEFRNAHRRSAGAAIQHEWLCEQIANVGKTLKMPLMFLKGQALHYAGHTAIGSRTTGDVDVLAPEARVEELQQGLIDSGLNPVDTLPAQHQLKPLIHPQAGMVEVHRMILGVRLNKASATLDEVIQLDLWQQAPEAEVMIPTRSLGLAHMLVHGIAQHGMDFSYPLMKLVGDVIDMNLEDDEWKAFLDGPYRWISRDVSRDEVLAVATLANQLKAGHDAKVIASGEGGESRLLRHVVQGSIDEEYQKSVRLQARMKTLAGGSRIRTLLRLAFKVFWLQQSQIDSLYGQPTSALGYWGWRLWRPFDVLLRSIRYSAAWWRIRRR